MTLIERIWREKPRPEWTVKASQFPLRRQNVHIIRDPNEKPTRTVIVHVKGCGELFITDNGRRSNVTTFKDGRFESLDFSLPAGARLMEETNGKDTGLRFLDLDGDGKLDIIFSNEREYGIYLFKNLNEGWSRKVIAGKAGDKDALPMIARNGTNNGFWVHSGSLWWSNEDTLLLRNHVDRREIKKLLERGR